MAHNNSISPTDISSIRSRFEAPPKPQIVEPVVRRERIKSTVDPKRREIQGEALYARQQSKDIIEHEKIKKQEEYNKLLQLPKELSTDSSEIRSLKRQIISKDLELRNALSKLNEVSNKLEKLIDRFTSSIVADEYIHSNTPSNCSNPVVAFSSTNNNNNQKENSHVDNSSSNNQKRKVASNNKPTSLEAILAAARSGNNNSKASPGTSSDRPKYAKLLRDFK